MYCNYELIPHDMQSRYDTPNVGVCNDTCSLKLMFQFTELLYVYELMNLVLNVLVIYQSISNLDSQSANQSKP